MMQEYIEPSPTAQRKLLVLVAAAMIFCLVWKFWAEEAFYGYIRSLPLCDQLPWWQGILTGVVAMAGFASLFMARYSIQLFTHGQEPLPDAWVLRRTPVIRGRKVRLKAYGVAATSIVGFVATANCALLLPELPFFKPVEQCTAESSGGRTHEKSPN